MPPSRWLNRPACAKPHAMAIEPTAVTIHDKSEIAPTLAMLVGSMMMPEPIMFTATMNVSWTSDIFFGCMSPSWLLLADHVRVKPDAAVLALLEHALDFVVEA